ncbi:MAG: hypothetical protein HC889_20070 [Synechococcaceae cyanobacterium SM1_2_3]|nr:hypothetical protein [Synechococcaceae cyanobacterium SM1_2_3]
MQLINSTVSGNRSPTNTGGGLDNYSTMTIANSTITGNSANTGGGIYNEKTLTLGNSLIAGNSAAAGNEIMTSATSAFISQGHNLFGVNGANGLAGAPAIPKASDITPEIGVLIGNIIDALNNSGGGPTETHLLKAVCPPSAVSCTEPAINAGSNALIPAGITTDQRGVGFPRILNDTVDIGAVEDASGIVIKHLLTVTKAGTGSGAVSSVSAGVVCGSDCTESYPAKTSVTLTATPASDSKFVGWTGDCAGVNPSCTVTMTKARQITAHFAPISHILAVAQIGVGRGVITSASPGIACGSDCIEIYPPGTAVTLTAAADADSSFGGWSGACSGVASCTVVMDSTQVVTATFNLIRHTLMVSKAGTGVGTVTSTAPGIACGADCGEAYAQGTSVTLTASAADGSTFVGWSGACGGVGSCQVTMTAARSITATFNARQ